MSKSKIEQTQTKECLQQDLSYKNFLTVVTVEEEDSEKLSEEFAEALRKLNEEIKQSMQEYTETQKRLIEIKQKSECSETKKSSEALRRQYRYILKMHQRIESKKTQKII